MCQYCRGELRIGPHAGRDNILGTKSGQCRSASPGKLAKIGGPGFLRLLGRWKPCFQELLKTRSQRANFVAQFAQYCGASQHADAAGTVAVDDISGNRTREKTLLDAVYFTSPSTASPSDRRRIARRPAASAGDWPRQCRAASGPRPRAFRQMRPKV